MTEDRQVLYVSHGDHASKLLQDNGIEVYKGYKCPSKIKNIFGFIKNMWDLSLMCRGFKDGNGKEKYGTDIDCFYNHVGSKSISDFKNSFDKIYAKEFRVQLKALLSLLTGPADELRIIFGEANKPEVIWMIEKKHIDQMTFPVMRWTSIESMEYYNVRFMKKADEVKDEIICNKLNEFTDFIVDEAIRRYGTVFETPKISS
ncbi:hypothetical protein MO973_06725 [Paenibacillus sp. TRM 82003]|nr:hypothetical protein [Paenibacillus sp. TRM 82003]